MAKWHKRTTTADWRMGPRKPKSTVLTEIEKAILVEFRRRTLLPLDDVLGWLRETIPKLLRGALHRCLDRHGISRLPSRATARARAGQRGAAQRFLKAGLRLAIKAAMPSF